MNDLSSRLLRGTERERLSARCVTRFFRINAHPWRLDLDWRWHQKALDYGCIFSINPDAHSVRELDHMHWGVDTPCRSRHLSALRLLAAAFLTVAR
jgi:hypothetical protein